MRVFSTICLWAGWFWLLFSSLQADTPSAPTGLLLAIGTGGLAAGARSKFSKAILLMSAATWSLLTLPHFRPVIPFDEVLRFKGPRSLGSGLWVPSALLPFFFAFLLMMVGQAIELGRKGAKTSSSQCCEAPIYLIFTYYGCLMLLMTPLIYFAMLLLVCLPGLLGFIATWGFLTANLPYQPSEPAVEPDVDLKRP